MRLKDFFFKEVKGSRPQVDPEGKKVSGKERGALPPVAQVLREHSPSSTVLPNYTEESPLSQV